MLSSSDQTPTSGATTVLIFLFAVPLMALVGVVFVRSLGLNENKSAAGQRTIHPKTAADDDGPAPVAQAQAGPPAHWSATEGGEQPSSAAVKPEFPSSPSSPPVVVQESPSQAKAASAREKPETEEAVTKSASRGILIEELSKETYNVLTELHAVLESEAWDEAAKLITSLDPATTRGLAPYFKERALLVSLPVAIQVAREDYPQIRQVLTENMSALAKLRVTQAMSAGNAAMVEFAVVQFAGTPAAAEAHRWLGDRALMQGRFAKAIFDYDRARTDGTALNEQLLPRLRLAAAMTGRDVGQPIQQPIQFGEVSMSPMEFEALVAEMRSVAEMKSRNGSSRPIGSSDAPHAVPPPSGFASHVRSRLEGAVGERPQDDLGRRINQLRVPWADRQIATVVEGDVLYVANRFQVAAYKLTSGERLWQSQAPVGQMQRAQEWGLIAMRPVIAGDRIYVRLLYSPSPLLVCLDKPSGKLLWVGESRENEFLVSDPFIVQGQLVALSVLVQPDQQGQLRYNLFDRRSGEIVQVHDLVKLRSTWGARACCEVSELEDGITVALGGVVLAVDGAANVRWVRTQNLSSPDDDRPWIEQMFQPPLLKDGRLYVAQPGVKTIECLAAATGRQYWSTVRPDVIGIVGIAGDFLVVRTATGVCGIDLVAGATRWRFDADNLFSFHLVDDNRLLLAGRERISGKGDRWQPRLTWLDPATGKHIANTAISSLADNDPRLGPLVPYKNRLFTFFGRGQHDPTRLIIELIPMGDADRVP